MWRIYCLVQVYIRCLCLISSRCACLYQTYIWSICLSQFEQRHSCLVTISYPMSRKKSPHTCAILSSPNIHWQHEFCSRQARHRGFLSTSRSLPFSLSTCWPLHLLINGCLLDWHNQWNSVQIFSPSLDFYVWCSSDDHYWLRRTIWVKLFTDFFILLEIKQIGMGARPFI